MLYLHHRAMRTVQKSFGNPDLFFLRFTFELLMAYSLLRSIDEFYLELIQMPIL